MLETYSFMYQNIKIGVFTHEIKEGIDWYTFKLTKKDIPDIMLPAYFYGLTNKDRNKKVQQVDILRFINSRVVPRNRQFLEVYLNYINLDYYNKWQIVKHNKGMALKDYFWLASEGDKYEELHPRYALENNLPYNWANPLNIEEEVEVIK